MKHIILALLFAITIQAAAQITLEQTYAHSGTFTFLPSAGNKFYTMDVDNSQCRIYNTDHSLWKTINLSVPTNNWLYDIKFVSEGLFSADNSIALLYVYYFYNETGEYYTYNARVVKENGQLLLNLPGCQYAYVHSLANGQTKLITYSYNYAAWPYTIQTSVYNLPGELITGSATEPVDALFSNQIPYPNPAASQITIPYLLPDDSSEGSLLLMDAAGRTVKSYHLNNNGGSLSIQTGNLPRGTYFYVIESFGYKSAKGKIILQ